MGKMTLEFDFPEEKTESLIALRSGDIYGDLHHLKEDIRGKLKHGEYKGRKGGEVAEEIYKEICEIVSYIEE